MRRLMAGNDTTDAVPSSPHPTGSTGSAGVGCGEARTASIASQPHSPGSRATTEHQMATGNTPARSSRQSPRPRSECTRTRSVALRSVAKRRANSAIGTRVRLAMPPCRRMPRARLPLLSPRGHGPSGHPRRAGRCCGDRPGSPVPACRPGGRRIGGLPRIQLPDVEGDGGRVGGHGADLRVNAAGSPASRSRSPACSQRRCPAGQRRTISRRLWAPAAPSTEARGHGRGVCGWGLRTAPEVIVATAMMAAIPAARAARPSPASGWSLLPRCARGTAAGRA